jgi:hypothetical protein
MAFTNLTVSQNSFLHNFLRGTGRTLTSEQAKTLYNIHNLRARISELRNYGLVVRTDQKTVDGRTKYAVSSRDVYGSRASLVR